jgi:MFS family permease
VRTALSVFVPVLRNRELRRVAVAYAGFQAAEYAVWIAILVYAFERGGTSTAALVAVAQLVPAALFAPIAGALADRYRPARVLAWGYVAQAAGMGTTASVLLADGPPLAAYAFSAVAATAVTVTRPTQAVVLPALARAPEELTAANVVTGWIESATALAGPVLAGVLLAAGSPGTVFAVFAAAAMAQAVLVWPVRGGTAPAAAELEETATAELTAGFRALAHNPHPRLLVALLAVAYVVWGALDILTVVLAVDILDIGEAGVGYLVAAFGAGGVVGAALAVGLVGRTRLVTPILFAAVVWGAAFALLGVAASPATAIALLVIAGTGQSLLDVAGRTLLQRISPPDVLARIFGIHEGLTTAALALGSLLVLPLVEVGGDVLAFALTGALLPVFVLAFLRRLLAIDGAATVPIVEISLLRSLPIFARLPPPALEGLARNLVPVSSPAGSVIIREGDPGDRYYAIADGEVVVTIRGSEVARRSRGDGFGEIALLRDVPRTATVTARTDTGLFALERDDFVIAVTGHAPTHAAATEIMASHTAESAGSASGSLRG